MINVKRRKKDDIITRGLSNYLCPDYEFYGNYRVSRIYKRNVYNIRKTVNS